MSQRFEIQDGTGIVVEHRPFGPIIYSVALTADIPADGGTGYALGGLLFNNQTGQYYQNIGSLTSCKFRVTYGVVGASFALPGAVAGYAKGAVIIDPATGYQYVNTGSDTSASFIAQNGSTLGTIQFPLESFRAIASNDIPALAGTPASGILAADSSPKYKRTNAATDPSLKIEWASSTSIEISSHNIIIPADMDTTKASALHVLALMGGAIDTPTITAKVFAAIGGTDAGGATAALSAALQNLSVAIAANTFSATFPTFATICLTPGAHTTDVCRLYGCYLQYTKKLLGA